MKNNFCLALLIILLPLISYSQELKRLGSVGLALTPVNDTIAAANKLEFAMGFYITDVLAGTTGEALKIKSGDILLAINGVKIISAVGNAVNKKLTKREGEEVVYTIWRGGKQIELKGKAVAKPYEQSNEFTVLYEQFKFGDGQSRCIITSPKTQGKKPAVLFIQGYTCNSIDGPPPANVYKKFTDELTRRGFIVMRAEKPGMGDSYCSANCYEIDFKTEVTSFVAAYKKLKTVPDVDTNNIFIIGHSLGGVEAPFVANEVKPKGIIVYGVTTKSWYEYLLEMLRFQNPNLGIDYLQVENEMKTYYTLLYDLLVKNRKVSEVVRENPACVPLLKRDFNYTGGEIFLTRDIVFSQSLNNTSLISSWKNLSCHVLSAFGEYDIQAINSFSHKEIVDIVNKNHPAYATYIEFPKTEHGFLELTEEREKWEIYFVPGAMKKAVSRGINMKVVDVFDNWMKALL
ncbi:MAG: alpha/beta hydrolase [Saprospiraceae bacterium]|nr:alpha/beta hydrolase [Saprospiraceae bacterium]